MDKIKTLIDGLVVAKKTPLVRLLGDELADRGANDFYTLYLLKKLDSENVYFDINQSNHTIEFTLTNESKGGISQFQSRLGPGQANSAERLRESIQKGVVSKEEVDQLIKIHQKHQRIISYTLHEQGINIYSHAPVDIRIIRALADKFNVKYYDNTPLMLAYTIEKINQKYLEVVQKNQLHRLINQAVLCSPDRYPVKQFPLEHIVWNRTYYTLDRRSQPEGYDYQLGYIYGHDSSAPEKYKGDNVVCLDSLFGKEVVPGVPVEQSGDAVSIGRFGIMAVNNPVFKEDGKCLTLAKIKEIDSQIPHIEFIQELQALCKNYRLHLDEYANDPILTSKQNIISKLENHLTNPSLDLAMRIDTFKLEFDQNKQTLAKHRGSAPEWLMAFFRGIRLVFLKYICQDKSLSNQSCFFRASHGGLLAQQIESKFDAKLESQNADLNNEKALEQQTEQRLAEEQVVGLGL